MAVAEITEPDQDDGDTVEVVDDIGAATEDAKPPRRRPRISKDAPRERRELDPFAR